METKLTEEEHKKAKDRAEAAKKKGGKFDEMEKLLLINLKLDVPIITSVLANKTKIPYTATILHKFRFMGLVVLEDVRKSDVTGKPHGRVFDGWKLTAEGFKEQTKILIEKGEEDRTS